MNRDEIADLAEKSRFPSAILDEVFSEVMEEDVLLTSSEMLA
jgi:hypothetical protein